MGTSAFPACVLGDAQSPIDLGGANAVGLIVPETHYVAGPLILKPNGHTIELTMPPCSEGVNWNVAATPIEAGQDEIWVFQSKMGVNDRPVQALNARPLVKPDYASGKRHVWRLACPGEPPTRCGVAVAGLAGGEIPM